jgi:hypothetical protein
MTDPDRTLEQKIDLTYQQLIVAPTEEAQRAAFVQMRDLIAQRSSAQVSRMEQEKGLIP